MLIALRHNGFRVVLFPSSREHGPPQVHVWKAGGEVIMELSLGSRIQKIRDVANMRPSDVAKAFRIVEDNSDFLHRYWSKYHGENTNAAI